MGYPERVVKKIEKRKENQYNKTVPEHLNGIRNARGRMRKHCNYSEQVEAFAAETVRT